MSIKELVNEKMKDAMRAHDEDGKRVYRMALASIKFAEKTAGKELDENDVISIIQKEIKIRKEALQEAVKAGREESIRESEKDIAALEPLLPKQLTAEELESVIRGIITEVGAAGAADMGKVMKAVMPKVKGLAPSDAVSRAVKELLSK